MHIINSLSNVLSKPREAFLRVKEEFRHEMICEKTPFSRHVFDFLFTLSASIGYILFSYVFLDGCIRLFSAAGMLFSFFFVLSVTRKSERVFLCIFEILALAFVLPIAMFFNLFRAFFKALTKPFTHFVKKKS